MEPFSVVEDLNILKQAFLQFVQIPEPLTVDPVGFHGLEERFSYRVVDAVSFAAHALNHFVFSQFCPE